MTPDSALASLSPDAELDQLLHPSQFYARPADVVADELLTVGERRAILSSWASDACAVDSNPPLRQPPFAQEPVTFDEIMDALTQLDRVCSRSLQPHPPLVTHTRPARGRRSDDEPYLARVGSETLEVKRQSPLNCRNSR